MQKIEYYGFQSENKDCRPLVLTAYSFEAILRITYGTFGTFIIYCLPLKPVFKFTHNHLGFCPFIIYKSSIALCNKLYAMSHFPLKISPLFQIL